MRVRVRAHTRVRAQSGTELLALLLKMMWTERRCEINNLDNELYFMLKCMGHYALLF